MLRFIDSGKDKSKAFFISLLVLIFSKVLDIIMTIYCRESQHVLADEIEAALEKSVTW